MAAEKMNGKWKRIVSSVEGYDETMDALGLSKEVKEQYRNANWSVQYTVLPNNQLEIASAIELYDQTHKMIVTFGEPYDTVFMDGTKAKGVVKMDGDVLVETMSDSMMKDGASLTTKRIFNGKQMTEIMTAQNGKECKTLYELVE